MWLAGISGALVGIGLVRIFTSETLGELKCGIAFCVLGLMCGVLFAMARLDDIGVHQ